MYLSPSDIVEGQFCLMHKPVLTTAVCVFRVLGHMAKSFNFNYYFN